MQFRLRTLFLLTAAVCVFCGVINAPPFIAIPLFFAAVWITPAYWVAGVIYGREGWRAFFIGGLASGAAPFLVLTLYTVSMGMWGWRFSDWSINDFGGIYGQYQLTNLIASLFIFAPVVLAFIGGWLSSPAGCNHVLACGRSGISLRPRHEAFDEIGAGIARSGEAGHLLPGNQEIFDWDDRSCGHAAGDCADRQRNPDLARNDKVAHRFGVARCGRSACRVAELLQADDHPRGLASSSHEGAERK